MSLEAKTERRRLIVGALATLATVSCQFRGDETGSNNEINPTRGVLITNQNIAEVIDLVVEDAKRFPLLHDRYTPQYRQGGKLIDFEGITKYDIPVNYEEYGVRWFKLLWFKPQNEPHQLIVLLHLSENVRYGQPFSNLEAGTPLPAYAFLAGGSRQRFATTSAYGQNFRKVQKIPEELETFFFAINTENIAPDLKNSPFIIHFNYGLFNVAGKDLPQFSLPFRITVKPPDNTQTNIL